MMFPGFMEGIRRIWEHDGQTQEYYLELIGQETRKLPVEAFKRFNAVFIPNDSYIRNYFGPESTNFQYELYNTDGTCALSNYVIFPFLNLLGQAVGWVCFKPFVRLKAEEENNWDVYYYEYPTSLTFNKRKYIFTLPSVYEAALKDRYIIITDGVFDTVSFIHYGLHSCSLLGSQFNLDLLLYFYFIDKIFVAMDNDAAGIKLYSTIKKLIPRAKKLQQTIGKDADDILKSEYRESYIKAVKDGIVRNTDVVFRQKFRT